MPVHKSLESHSDEDQETQHIDYKELNGGRTFSGLDPPTTKTNKDESDRSQNDKDREANKELRMKN